MSAAQEPRETLREAIAYCEHARIPCVTLDIEIAKRLLALADEDARKSQYGVPLYSSFSP